MPSTVACKRFGRAMRPKLVHNFARLRLPPMNSIPLRGHFKCWHSKGLEEGFRTASSRVRKTIQRSFSIKIFVALTKQQRNLMSSSSQLNKKDSIKLALWTLSTSNKRRGNQRYSGGIRQLFLERRLHTCRLWQTAMAPK